MFSWHRKNSTVEHSFIKTSCKLVHIQKMFSAQKFPVDVVFYGFVNYSVSGTVFF